MVTKTRSNVKDIFFLSYICLLAVYMTIREIMPLQFLISNTLVSVAIFGVGFALIFWDFFSERVFFRNRAVDILVAFIAVCCLSSLVHFKFGITDNVKTVAAMVLEYFLFFSFGRGKTAEENKKSFRCLMITLSAAWFIFVSVSLLMYYGSVDFVVTSALRNNANQGYSTQYQRLWGVFQDPNYAGYVSTISIFTSVYFIASIKKVWAYIVFGVNILAQLCFITLGGSRSAFLILLIVIPVGAVYYLLVNGKKTAKEILRTGAIALVALGVCAGTVAGLRFGLPYTKAALSNSVSTGTSEKVAALYKSWYDVAGVKIIEDDTSASQNPSTPDKNSSSTEQNPLSPIERTDLGKEDVSNGRLTRWKDTVKIFLKTPILGTSPRNVSAFAKEHQPNTLMAKYNIAPHNAFLDVLVGTGIIGAVIIAAFAIIVLIALFKYRKCYYSKETMLCFMCVTTLAGSMMFVSDIFFSFSVGAFCFFTLCGFLYNSAVNAADEKPGILFNLINRIFKLFKKERG